LLRNVLITNQNGTFYYHRDHQGSIVALTDSSREVVESFTYDNHYGTIINHTKITETNNPYAYTGRELDTSELYYYRARYYDPQIQRFISEDPIGFMSGDFNFYRYVGNSPVNFGDPSGLILEYEIEWWKDFFGGVGDFLDNYSNMQAATNIIHNDGSRGWAKQDQYFHCLANCQATNRGDGGYNAARLISELRELTDEYFKGNSAEDCNEDRKVNKHGQKGGNCAKRCEKFRPGGSFPY